MKGFAKILVILSFIGLGLTAYAGSQMGWGVHGLGDRETEEQIKKNCPNYYQNRNGECLSQTFRSYFLIRSVRGGSFGGGK